MKKSIYKSICVVGFVCLTLFLIFGYNKISADIVFAKLTISCDKEYVKKGDNFVCTLTANITDKSSAISSFQLDLGLTDGIEYVSFAKPQGTDWYGSAEETNLSYAFGSNMTPDANGNISLGTYTFKVSSDTTVTQGTITTSNISFSDGNFELKEGIENATASIKLPTFSSTYTLNSDYFVSDTTSIADIISEFTVDGCSAYVLRNTSLLSTGTLTNGDKLVIKFDDSYLATYDIVYTSSSVYDLSKEILVTTANNYENFINDITYINCTPNDNFSSGNVTFKHNTDTIASYTISKISSSKYDFSNNQLSILINEKPTDNNINSIINNISVTNGDITYEKESSNYIIKVTTGTTTLLKTYTISYIVSTDSKYTINFDAGYIYAKDNSLDLTDISSYLDTNVELTTGDNNTLLVTNFDKSFVVTGLTSNTYTIDYVNKYINVGNINLTANIVNSFECENCYLSYDDSELLVYLDEESEILIETYDLWYYYSSLYTINDNKIVLSDSNKTVKDILDSFSSNKISLVIKRNTSTLNSGDAIQSDDKLVVLDSEGNELKTINLVLDYLNFENEYRVNTSKKVLIGSLGYKYSDISSNILTSGDIKYYDKSGTLVADNGTTAKTSSTVKITLVDEVKTYSIAIIGDVTNDGAAAINDVAKLYQEYKKTIPTPMSDVEKIAGDVNYNLEIDLGDVAKLYQYIKGTYTGSLDHENFSKSN